MKALTRFEKDTAEHQMEVLLDNGLHRHLKFSNAGSSVYRFDIVTWPGYLSISGDMGTSVFRRMPDMLEFFRNDQRKDDAPDVLRINPGYWAEKCVANDGERKKFDESLFEQVVREHFDHYMAEQDDEAVGFAAARDALWDHLKAEVVVGADDTRSALERWGDFSVGEDNTTYCTDMVQPDRYAGWFKDFKVRDAWEWSTSVEDYTFHFYWRLYAIAYAVRAYDSRSVPA
ncbi:hypothetical protein ROV94_15700 [Stenotrophomonas maltophilia]|uniref:hypothetical protein n=1 Tax=Stenotrophomonas maltophilia TaxID=40324 RepID=UPI00289500DB|nr:hypothetical protein [Stenotrophomonas maltophilia]MDT3432312.1 hypothetical protein [Stenotrophomonas maltophilia]